LDDAGGRRPWIVAADRAEHDQVDLFGSDACHIQSTLRRPGRQVRSIFAIGSDVPLADPGPRHDPLVRGIDKLLEVLIGQGFFRNV